MQTVIEHVRLIGRVPDGQDRADSVLVIEDDTIVYAGAMASAPSYQADAHIIDGQGRIAMPGFVNAHAHSPMVLFRSAADDLPLHTWLNERIWPLESHLNEERVYWGSLLAMAEMIRTGTVAFNDMYFFSEQIFQATEESGLKALLTRCVTCNSTVPAEMENSLAQARAFCERFEGGAGGRVHTTIAPHAEYTCSAPFLQKCGALAQELGVPMHIHISETQNEHEECKQRHQGLTPLGLLEEQGCLQGKVLAAHCVYVEPSDIDLMVKHSIVPLHCPVSNLKLGSGIAPVAHMLERGIPVAIGTDGAASNNNLNMIEEMRFATFLQKGIERKADVLPAQQALAMATQYGAQALGTGGGVLQPGYKADLILLDVDQPHMVPMHNASSQVVYSAQGSDVYLTMVDGRILYQAGEYKTLDIERIRKEAQRAAEELV